MIPQDPQDRNDDELFREMVSTYHVPNELLAAMRQAEQELWALHPEGGYPLNDVAIMQLAWSRLAYQHIPKAMESLFTCYRHTIRETQERLDMFAAAKAEGLSFLEEDDLDIVAYSLSVFDMGEDGTMQQEVTDEGGVSVPLDALCRLVQEVKRLRFKEAQGMI